MMETFLMSFLLRLLYYGGITDQLQSIKTEFLFSLEFEFDNEKFVKKCDVFYSE